MKESHIYQHNWLRCPYHIHSLPHLESLTFYAFLVKQMIILQTSAALQYIFPFFQVSTLMS